MRVTTIHFASSTTLVKCNEMTSDLDIWQHGSTWPCLGQVWRSRSQVKVQGWRMKQHQLRLHPHGECKCIQCWQPLVIEINHYNPFTALFSGTTRVSRYQKRLLNFMVQGEINRGRHTDHPAGRHSIRTNQCPPPPAPPHIFLQAGCPFCRPTNSVKALKATSTFGLGRRR